MKQSRRTRVAAEYVQDAAHPYVRLSEIESPEGGRFGLHPLSEKGDGDSRTVCLPHPTLPRYDLTITGSSQDFDRLGRLFLTVSRGDTPGDAPADSPADDAGAES